MKPQRNSGTSQSRPHPARPVKGEESAGLTYTSRDKAGPEVPGRRGGTILTADIERIDRRVPSAKAWKHSEHSLQKHIICRLELLSGRFPDLEWIHAIPNGGHRSKAAAGKMRAEGQKKGVPDLCLPVPRRAGDRLYHGLYLELKKAGGAPSEDQWEWLIHLHRSGYAAHVANDPDTAVKLITDYLSLSPP